MANDGSSNPGGACDAWSTGSTAPTNQFISGDTAGVDIKPVGITTWKKRLFDFINPPGDGKSRSQMFFRL